MRAICISFLRSRLSYYGNRLGRGNHGPLRAEEGKSEGTVGAIALGRSDYGIALALFVVALALRVPFRSQFAYYWDSAQFALAVGEYNIRISQPHVPGFYLYILAGRLMNLFVGEPHAALVWLSVFAGAWLVSVGYLLATLMFGRNCGWGTGLILLTSPLTWFHSEIALTTILDSALVVSFVFVCWRAIQRNVTWFQTIVLAALLAAAGGLRQQTAALLVPLWIYVFWGFAQPRARKFFCATVLAAGLSLLWFLPMLKSAGGLGGYLDLLRLKCQFDRSRIAWAGGGVFALFMDVYCMGRALWVGLWIAAILPLMELAHWVFYEKGAGVVDSYRANRRQLRVLGLWIAPMLLFGLLMYVERPGHALNLFPAVVILASLGLVRFSRQLVIARSWGLYVVFAIVMAVNAALFLFAPPLVTRLSLGLRLSAREIQEHDTDLQACFRVIRQNWPAKDVIVYHWYEDFFWGFRQFQYHLPEYRNVLLRPDASLPRPLGGMAWIGYERRTAFVDVTSIPQEQDILQKEDILLVVPPGESVEMFRSTVKLGTEVLLLESGVKLYVLHLHP